MQMRAHDATRLNTMQDVENLLQDDVENLLQASFCGDATTLKALLLRGVSAESCGPGGHLALPLACAGGHSATAACRGHPHTRTVTAAAYTLFASTQLHT